MPTDREQTCCPCGKPSDGWPGDVEAELCQDCWEAYCSKTWWAEIERQYWEHWLTRAVEGGIA